MSPIQKIADPIDLAMMRRCIELSRAAIREGEYPFATVIAMDGKVIAEAINHQVRDGDVSRHAEVIALSQAQKVKSRKALRGATLYTNVEPCAMCSYCLREVQVGRVVYAIGSPVMGGDTKWNILQDDDMTDRLPQVFGVVPEVVSGAAARRGRRGVAGVESGRLAHDRAPRLHDRSVGAGRAGRARPQLVAVALPQEPGIGGVKLDG